MNYAMKHRTQSGNISFNHILIFFISLSVSLFFFKNLGQKPIRYTPGTLVSETPVQTSIWGSESWKVGNYTITPIAKFSVRARVLHTKNYSHDQEADLSPIDLALGWGSMSDQAVLDQLTITQSGRWYHWRYQDQPPIPREDIVSQSGNMHMIPADSHIKNTLEAIQEGNIIRLNGYLVKITGPNNYYWNSSTSRTDAGNGSCEVVWVEYIVIER